MTPLIYNLFPRLVGPVTRWPERAARAAGMGFNWLYLNPWHYPGFSGSLYAPREFRRLNPAFVPPGADTCDLGLLKSALGEIEALGLRPMMDLVINHTSKDAPLTEEHHSWYVRDQHGDLVSPSVVDPDDPSKVTVWGDLAEIDNAGSPDRDRLWAYWGELVRDSLALGFRGFRCDAAYKVPVGLWSYLIAEARRVDPEVEFFAETLGAPLEQISALREAGFDYIFNSSKYWNFREPWAIEQHERFRDVAPSISFPESHDTPRLAAETGGSEVLQRQRYAFAAGFSAGLMMPIGYEYGFRKQVNVVTTRPTDWERRSFDLTGFIRRVNGLKLSQPVLQGEAAISTPWGLEGDVLLLQRDIGQTRGWMLVNKNASRGFEIQLPEAALASTRLHRVCLDGAPEGDEAVPERVNIQPAEVLYVLPG